MRVLYVNLTAPFSLHMMYKENYLIRAFRENGDEVLVLCTLEEYKENQIYRNQPGTDVIDKTLCVNRVVFHPYLYRLLTDKIRKTDDYIKICIDFSPDVIILNGIQFYNVRESEKIKKALPGVRIYGDVSAAAYNSATNWLSYHILHKGIYRRWIKEALGCFDKIFYVSKESKDFLEEMYQVPGELLEEQGLCCEVIDAEDKKMKREKFLKSNRLPPECIIFSHTGKMDAKKNTLFLMEEFHKTANPDFRLFLAGAFDSEICEKAVDLIDNDNRMIFLGFLKYPELIELLASTDLYLQPGGPSQTLQTAIGCLSPALVQRMEIYENLLGTAGIYIDSIREIGPVFEQIEEDRTFLTDRAAEIERIAEKINYKNIAQQFYDKTCDNIDKEGRKK